MKFGTKRLNGLLPITVGSQAPSGGTSDAMLAVKLDVEWVIDMTARADGDANAVREFTGLVRIDCRRLLHLRFVQLKANLREIVQLRNRGAADLCLDTALENAVQQGIDVRLLGKVEVGLGIIRLLHEFQVLHNLLEQRKGGQQADLEL